MKKISPKLKAAIKAKKKDKKHCTCVHDEEYGYLVVVVGGTPNQSDHNLVMGAVKEGIHTVFVHGNPKPPCPPGGCGPG